MSKTFKIILLIFLVILIFSFVIHPVRNLIINSTNSIYKSIFNGVHKIPWPIIQKNQILTPLSLSKAEKTLNKLSLEQKIGQMLLIGIEGQEITPEIEELVNSLHPGGILLLGRNIKNENQLENFIQSLQKIALEDTGLPLFIAVDQEGEPMNRIEFTKEKTSQSEIKNIEQSFEIGFNRGKELKELGINLNLAPVLDIAQPGDFLFERSFQKDSQLAGELAKVLISGQKESGILTAIKHFPGYGGISFNPERIKLPVLSEIPEISQFEKAFEARPEMIMAANVIYSEIDKNSPFTLSQKSIEFLREKLKNDFLIISDDLSSPVLKKEFSLEKTITLAVKSGVDILIVAGFDNPEDPSSAFNALLEAVKTGEISEAKINKPALKIIKLKQNMLKPHTNGAPRSARIKEICASSGVGVK